MLATYGYRPRLPVDPDGDGRRVHGGGAVGRPCGQPRLDHRRAGGEPGRHPDRPPPLDPPPRRRGVSYDRPRALSRADRDRSRPPPALLVEAVAGLALLGAVAGALHRGGGRGAPGRGDRDLRGQRVRGERGRDERTVLGPPRRARPDGRAAPPRHERPATWSTSAASAGGLRGPDGAGRRHAGRGRGDRIGVVGNNGDVKTRCCG